MNPFRLLQNRIHKIISGSITPIMIVRKKNFQNQKINNTRISSSTFIDHSETLFIEDNIFIGHFNFIEASHNIYIEEGVQITSFCSITTHSSHISIRLYGKHYVDTTEHAGYVTGEIHIGKYTFVGPHTLIMPGTKIGKGCIVSAYSLLKGHYPDYSVIAGNPAKVIGSTKDIDQEYLIGNQNLKAYYDEWSAERN